MIPPLKGIVLFLVVALALVVTQTDVVDELRQDPRGCEHADRPPGRAGIEAARAATLCLLNMEREEHGVGPLEQDRALERAAQHHSEDMVARRFFDHDDPDGRTPEERMRAAGYEGPRTAENIAHGARSQATPVRITEGWMDSPDHRRNILDPLLTEIGIGIALRAPREEGEQGATYTTNFGGR